MSGLEGGTSMVNELPEGWVTARLGDVLEINYGRGLKESDRAGGRVPVYGSNGVVGRHDKALTGGPTLVIGRKGSVGAVHYSPCPCWPIDTTYFVDDFHGMEGAFLLYALRVLDLPGLDRSTAVPGLNRDDAYAQAVDLPPLAEQKRIVAKVEELLWRANAARERLARVPAILKRFRQSVLAAACSGRLTEGWREQRQAPDAPSDESGLPTGWRRKRLDDHCSRFQYGSSRKSAKEGKVPVLRMGNIQNGEIDWSDLVFTSDVEEIRKYRLQPGAVLFNRTNSPGLVGKTAIYRGDRPAVFAGYLIRIHHGPQLVPEYLNYCLNTPEAKEYCSAVRTDGVSQSNINAKKLAAYEMPWCKVEEQQEIVRRVEALFKLADAVERRVKGATLRAEKLTQAVLARAFRGELVPTEADLARREGRDYEPASVLLDRIRAERTPQAAASRPRTSKRPRSARKRVE